MPFDYVYNVPADFYGGTFTSNSSANLQVLSDFLIPGTALTSIASGGATVTLTYAAELSAAQKTILDGDTSSPAGGIVGRCNDYLQVIYEDPLPAGATSLDNTYFAGLPFPNLISDIPVLALLADGFTYVNLTLQYTRGDGITTVGYSNLLNTWPNSIITISEDQGTLNGSGQFLMRIGPSYDRGIIDLAINTAYLQPITVRVKFYAEAA